MSQTQVECLTDAVRLAPVGTSRILPGVHRALPFDECLRRATQTPEKTAPGETAEEEEEEEATTTVPSAGGSESVEDTDPTQPSSVADSDEDGGVQEADAAQGKSKAEEGQEDEETDTSDDEQALAETGNPSVLAVDVAPDSESVQPAPVCPDQQQQTSEGQGKPYSFHPTPMHQGQKPGQSAEPLPEQPASQPLAAAESVPEEVASSDAETTMTAEPAEDTVENKADATVAKKGPAAPESPVLIAEPAEVPGSDVVSGASTEAPMPSEPAGPTGDGPTAETASEPAPSAGSNENRQTPAAGTEPVPGDPGTDALSPESDGEKADTPETREPTASGKTVQNETGGPLRAAPGGGTSQAASAPGQEVPSGGDAQRARFVQRVARAFQAVGGDGGSVRLRLRPPELGSLRLELSVRNGAMAARLEVETAAARNALLDNLPALRDRLAQQDVKIERFDVDLADERSGGSPRQPGDHPQPGRHSAWDGPPPEDRPKVAAESVAAPASMARTSDGSQLNVVI